MPRGYPLVGAVLAGRPKSEEHRKRIGDALRGQPKSTEHKGAMREAWQISETRVKHSGEHNGNFRHGMYGTPTHISWRGAVQRCSDPRHKDYARYGGRGITCNLSFEDLYTEIGERPEGMSLDRINNDGNYERGNIRWATPKEQRANQRHCATCCCTRKGD